jgi:hypothetical protein
MGKALAMAIEEQIFLRFGKSEHTYKTKYRSLSSNFQLNPNLKKLLIAKSISPEKLVNMNHQVRCVSFWQLIAHRN